MNNVEKKLKRLEKIWVFLMVIVFVVVLIAIIQGHTPQKDLPKNISYESNINMRCTCAIEGDKNE